MTDAAQASVPILDIENLKVGFWSKAGLNPAVKGVNIHVNEGETVALVGESGSGKSVTALSVLQLLAQSAEMSGSIKYRGDELVGSAKKKIRHVRGNEISMIFQEPMTALNPLHTIERQIAESLKLHGGVKGNAARKRVLELMHQVGIRDPETRLGAYPHQLSGGQRQRVMIAMALANGPELLIADEPHEYTRMLLNAEPTGLPQPIPEPNSAPVIEGENVKVWFPIKEGFFRRTVGHVKAVQDISCQVRAGETLGVVGESGSGKTTLGLALVRLISSKGRIAFLGRDIQALNQRKLRPLRRDMQVVFQDPYGSLSPRMSVAQIIAEGLQVHGIDGDTGDRRKVIADTLIEVGLEPEMMDRYPHEFSGGQRQRISIARAMALKPKLVVLDEPTSALDMSVQSQIVDLLRDLQVRYKLAYVFISHDLKVVRALSHRVIVMRNGLVVEEGVGEAVFENPQTDYARALMAAAFRIEAEGDENIVSA